MIRLRWRLENAPDRRIIPKFVTEHTMECEEAWLRLKAGNERFVRGGALHPHQASDWRRSLAYGHRPLATILGCSDPMSPPELLFDQGFGDLFVIRVAGNVVAPDVLGSLQYAGAHLGTRLFVVLGHEGCGTVRAALEEHAGRSSQAGHIASVIHLMLPAMKGLAPASDLMSQLDAAVEANVRWSLRQLTESPSARKSIEQKHVKFVGAVCETRTGFVRFLE